MFGTIIAFFLIGISCFVGSIYLICYNEKRSIKDSYYIDLLKDTTNVEELRNPSSSKIPQQDIGKKIFILSGDVTIKENAKITDFDDFPLNGIDNLLTIKVHVEEFDTRIDIEDYRDSRGNLLRRDETVTTDWYEVIPVDEHDFSRVKSQYYYSNDVNFSLKVDSIRRWNLFRWKKV